MSVERFVALRYLRPRRGRGLVSIVATIAILAFAAGVGALILALAVTDGLHDVLEQELVGATAHLNLVRKQETAFSDYRQLMERLRTLPHVQALAPVLYNEVFLGHGDRRALAVLKGVNPKEELRVSEVLNKLTDGTWQPLESTPEAHTLVLGKDLADTLGVFAGDWIDVYVPRSILTPVGLERTARAVEFQVVGIFQTGFPDFDSRWAYTSLKAAQQLAPDTTGQSNDRASAIEFRLDDLNRAEEVGHQAEAIAGPQFTAVPWMAANRPVFQALKLEKLGTLIVIGLIVFVAAMNVLTMLTMLVIEKRKEIAVLLSMGTKRKQIRRLFVYQGIVIDLVGTALGLLLGYSLAWGANTFHWVKVPPEVYAVDYIPFHAHVIDGVLVAALALVVSLAATAYPARRAVAIVPAETLRYE